jgi:D-serine dehydratase
VLLSAGGSGFFDLVVTAFNAARLERRTTTLLRSGCYITHDSGLYTFLFSLLNMRAPELLAEDAPSPALRVWAYVQSMPEPGRAIVTMGKRDVGFDEMPAGTLASPQRRHVGAAGAHARPSGHRTQRPARVSRYPARIPAAGGRHDRLRHLSSVPHFRQVAVLHVIDGAFDVIGSIRTYF